MGQAGLPAPAMRILLVEDSPSDADLVQQALQLSGAGRFDFTCVERLQDALARLGNESFDVLLLDLSLPDSSGAETFRRAHSAAPLVPIVVLTGANDESLGLTAVQEGVQDYLVKGQADGRQIARAIRYAIERKQAGEQLRQQEEWLRVTLASIGDAVIAGDTHGRVNFLNPVAESLTGWKADEALGQPIQRVFHIINELTRQPADDLVSRVLSEKRVLSLANHTALLTKDGHERPVEDSAAPILAAAGQVVGVVVVFHCVADKRLAQTVLAAAHAQAVSEKNRLDAVMESLPVGVAILDSEGGIVRSNKAFGKLWGKPRPQAQEVHDYAKFKAWWADSGLPVQPEEWASAQAVQQGRTVVGQLMRIETFDGAQRFVQNSAAPIRDPGGEIVGCVVAIDDVTELERAELELRRSNEDLSQFAFAISHDLRSPLNAVSSYAKQIAEEYGDKLGGEAGVYLSYLTSATDRMRHFISDLLAYSRVAGDSGGNGAQISSDEALRSAELNLQGRIHETRAVITHDPLPDVVGSSTLLAQLFQNLLENAMKFRGEKAPLIRVSVERGDQEWVFCVSDNGIGIDPKRIEQVFLIFKRMHGDQYEGTGIGLAICRKIVERHGGRIWAESGLGKGTRFYFTLPVRAVVGEQSSAL